MENGEVTQRYQTNQGENGKKSTECGEDGIGTGGDWDTKESQHRVTGREVGGRVAVEANQRSIFPHKVENEQRQGVEQIQEKTNYGGRYCNRKPPTERKTQ